MTTYHPAFDKDGIVRAIAVKVDGIYVEVWDKPGIYHLPIGDITIP